MIISKTQHIIEVHNFSFATNLDDLRASLTKAYITDTPWSDMDTNDLEFWLDRYEDEGHEVPCFSLERGAL